jgi:hypothetical protein
MKHLNEYKQYCSESQWVKLKAFADTGSYAEGARATGCDRSNFHKAVKAVLFKAAQHGFSPEHDLVNPVPESHLLKGASTLYKEGKPVLQWVKSQLNIIECKEQAKSAIKAFYEDLPVVKVPKAPKLKYDQDVIPWIQIGDAHFGMLAHEWETGENFDLKIAERELCTAIKMLIDECKPCERVVINDLGDFTHYENFEGVTQASGHALDFDGRFPKMVTVYSRTMRFIVDECLKKFKYVDVIINQGNHSRTNDIWMVELLRCAYQTDRVNVMDNSSIFIPYRMGNTFVMTHHSDKCRPNKLANVMATDFSNEWGEAEYRYIDIGHIHHNMVLKEHPGVVIESFNILAPMDKYAHDGGWRSRSSITMVFRSKKYGEIGRRKLPVEQVRDSLEFKGRKKIKRRKVYSV